MWGEQIKFRKEILLMQNVPDLHRADFKELFNRVIEDLKSHPKIVGISLHGSLLSGEQDEFSDVDLDILIWRNWSDLEKMHKDFEKLVEVWPKPDPQLLKKLGYAQKSDWGIRILGRFVFDFNFKPIEAHASTRIEKLLSCQELDTTGIIDIVEGQILYDRQDYLAQFKRGSQNYPVKLSRCIVKNRPSCLTLR